MSFLRNHFAWFHLANAVAATAIKRSPCEIDPIVARPQILPRRIRKREPASLVRVREEILKMVSAEKLRDVPFDPFADSAKGRISPQSFTRQLDAQSGERDSG